MIWYAQNNSTSITTAGQWKSLDGLQTLIWAELAPDDVLVANGKTNISIDTNVVCARLTTKAEGGTAGGGFICNKANVIITANADAGTTIAIVFSQTAGNVAYITGTATGGSNTGADGIRHTGAGTLNIVGGGTGGTADSAAGIRNNSGGTINITSGTIQPGGYYSNGVYNAHAGTMNISNCNIINTTYGSAIGGKVNVSMSATNYIRYPAIGGGNVDFPLQLAEDTIKVGVVSGTVTGTYAGSGGGASTRRPMGGY